MKCLTVCEPWATALVHGIKCIENRTWPMGHRGDLLIHAGKSIDWFTNETCEEIHAVWPAFPPSRLLALDRLKGNLGKIIGIVRVLDCQTLDQATRRGYERKKHFAEGPYCIITDIFAARRFKRPIPWRGQQGVYEVPDVEVNGPTLRRGEKA